MSATLLKNLDYELLLSLSFIQFRVDMRSPMEELTLGRLMNYHLIDSRESESLYLLNMHTGVKWQHLCIFLNHIRRFFFI